MKINSSSLRLAMLVILVKIVIKLSWVITFLSFLRIEELSFDIDTYINALSLLVELFLTYYFLIFLNQFLSFKKANLFLWILMALDIVHLIYLFYLKPDTNNFPRMNPATYFILGEGAVIMITKITLAFRVLIYSGIFRKQMVLYAASIFAFIVFQMFLVPLSTLLSMTGYSYINYGSQFISLLPSIALFWLLYNALKQPDLLKEKDSSDFLDSTEFSI